MIDDWKTVTQMYADIQTRVEMCRYSTELLELADKDLVAKKTSSDIPERWLVEANEERLSELQKTRAYIKNDICNRIDEDLAKIESFKKEVDLNYVEQLEDRLNQFSQTYQNLKLRL